MGRRFSRWFAGCSLFALGGCNQLLGNEPRQLDQPFGTCQEPGALRCAGETQKLTLYCDGTSWLENGVCAADENCDRSSGTCGAIVPACRDLLSDGRYCRDNQLRACGPDLVGDELVEQCPNLCHGGECARLQQVVAGAGFTCVLFTTGKARCWGRIATELIGLCPGAELSTGDLRIDGRITSLASGGAHVCARLEGGSVRCWGCGDFGQLGYGNTEHVAAENASDIDVGGAVVSLAAGGFHTCALLDGGSVRCWGFGLLGQLGYGDVENVGDDEAPYLAGDVSLGGAAEQLTTGMGHSCALLTNGRVRCWGLGDEGQLGLEDRSNVGDDELPSQLAAVDVGASVIQLSAGGTHTCALLESGHVRCWGDSRSGKLGYQDSEQIGDRPGDTPAAAGDVRVLGEDDLVRAVAAGGHHTCALLESGSVRCWGEGWDGQLGTADLDEGGDPRFGDEPGDRARDVEIGQNEHVTGLAAGYSHNCVTLQRGAVRCWGQGITGALGYETPDNVGDDESPASAGDVPLVDPE